MINEAIDFRLSGIDPRGALRAAAAADDSWASGYPRNPGTWAQVRIGAAIAYLLQDSLDGAAEQVTQVLGLPPKMRIATVTGWMSDFDRQLTRSRFTGDRITTDLKQQIRDFADQALSS